ncbi:MAG: HAD-IA family hydrolase [Desulfobacteraceae bacterium]|nr:HAD-IA family hydrolase [Desulfobacteraceae bacterium]
MTKRLGEKTIGYFENLGALQKQQYAVLAVLFDFDGTLTHPGSLNLSEIRNIIGCPAGKPILEYISSLPETESASAMATLDAFELEAAGRAVPNDGAEELISYLKAENIGMGIISRNTQAAIERAMRNFRQTRMSDFQVIISRDAEILPKPHPHGILLAAERMNVLPEQVMMVGDYIFDIQAGKQAKTL